MCDAEKSTLDLMRKSYPSLFRKLSKGAGYLALSQSKQQSLQSQLSAFFADLEHMLPEEHQECLIYALILIERGFSHGVFLHGSTVKRLFAIAFSLAFKMLTDIDVMGLNSHLARSLGMSVSHFNDIESVFFMAIDFNAGVTEEAFAAKVKFLDQ